MINVEKTSQFNRSIHGLRGVAAFSVFLFHVYDMSRKFGLSSQAIAEPLRIALVSLAGGVDLFFMISGYLITGSLIRHGKIKSFLVDRAIRIYPVFLFLHVALFATAPLVKYKWLADLPATGWLIHFVSNLLLLPGVFDLPIMQMNAWSLSFEAAFYLLCSAIYALWHWNQRYCSIFCAVAIPVLLFIYPRAISFGIGSLVYFILREQNSKTRAKWPRVGILAVAPFLAIVGYALVIESNYLFLAAAPFGLLIFIDVARSSRPFERFLSNPAAQFMGTISYSFYLWHPVVMFPIKVAAGRLVTDHPGLNHGAGILLFGVVALLTTIPISYLSYRLLEKRCGTWLRYRLAQTESQRLERPGVAQMKPA